MTERKIFCLYSFYDEYFGEVRAGRQFPLKNLENVMKKVSKYNVIAFAHTNIVPIISTFSRRHPKWKKILMVRDLRDVLISNTFWKEVKKRLDTELGPNSSVKERIRYLLINMTNETVIFQTALKAFEWSKRDPKVLVCRFEDLVGPQGGGNLDKQKEALVGLASHIGIKLTQEKLDDIIDHLFGNTFTFRSGQIGSWEKHFDKEISELFKKSPLGDVLIALGYENDHNW